MKKFLFETYTEEIPAKLLNNLTSQLKELAEKKLSEFNLQHGEIYAYSTPRRLVLYIDGVSEKENDTVQEIKGPSYKIAFDENGNPTEVLKKFLENNNLSKDDIFEKDVKGNKYVFGNKKISGRDAREILKEVCLYALKNLSFPRGMRWNDSKVVFIRPIRNFLLLFDTELLPFEYAGVKSERKSFGLMVEDPIPFEPKDVDDYFVKLRERYVILEFSKRKEIIQRESQRLAQKVSGKVKFESDFLEEVTNLNEFPTPFLGNIVKDKLEIPDCIVESVVKDHLKAFPVYSEDGSKVLPYFVGVRNGTSDFIENVIKGYEKVARARIYDGAFFFNEDRKETLKDRVPKLKDVVFIKGLGSMYEKVERLTKISEFLIKTLPIEKPTSDYLMEASYLSKADILTNVVKEFPELQGTMGGIYARLEGYPEEVTKAIEEQYLPRFAEDELPKTLTGKFLSIIDKLDTLVLSIASQIEFSSSKDPFGLRRQALAIAQVALNLAYDEFPFEELIDFIENFAHPSIDKLSVKEKVIDLIKERTNYYLKSKGIDYDKANAVVNLPINKLPTYLDRASILQKHSKDEKFAEIATAHKRLKNILKSSNVTVSNVLEGLLFEPVEKELFEQAKETQKLLGELEKSKDYEAIIHLFYLFVPTVNKFFDNVLVMDKNEDLRNNRLALIKFVKDIFEEFADFSEVVIQ